MHTLFDLIVAPSAACAHGAFVFLRIAIGFLTMLHGFPKIMSGASGWQSLGGVMAIFGIHFLPTMWGCIAACTEFFGGIALMIGLGTRVAAFFNVIMMFVALGMHLQKKDPFTIYSFALTMIVVFMFLLFAGSGPLSLDSYLYKK